MRKPRVLIYADVPGWAYDNISNFLKEKFKEDYDWYYDYTLCHRYTFKDASFLVKIKSDIINVARFSFNLITGKGLTKLSCYTFMNCSLTFFWNRTFFWNDKSYSRRVLPFWSSYDAVILLDYYFDRVARLSFRSKRIVTGLYFDSFPPPGCKYDFLTKKNPGEIESLEEFSKEYLRNTNAIAAGSPSIAIRFRPYFPNIHFCNAIHKEEIFIEKNITLKQSDEPFIVGWTGNPLRDFKNFNTIVKPVVEHLQEKGLNIVLKTRFSGPYDTLPQFYMDVDIVLIASEKDAGPFMFAEASLSGVPSISTNVGFPSHVVENQINGFLVDLNFNEFSNRIEYLYFNRGVLFEMSKRIRPDYLKKMGSNVLIDNWRGMFRSIGV